MDIKENKTEELQRLQLTPKISITYAGPEPLTLKEIAYVLKTMKKYKLNNK